MIGDDGILAVFFFGGLIATAASISMGTERTITICAIGVVVALWRTRK